MNRLHTIATASLVIGLSGCAVGPNFKKPAPPAVSTYTAQPLPASTASAGVAGGAAQRFLPGGDIPAQWWTLFRSKPLDTLITQALAANPDLQAAQATLRQARETYLASIGGLLPSLDASFQAQRQKTSGALFGRPGAPGSIYSLYNAQAQVSYTLDVFGGVRRQIEENRAAVDYQRFQLEGAYLTLTSNVVTTAVQIATLNTQIQALREVIDAQRQIVDVVRRQVALGGASDAALLQQQAQLAQTLAQLPPLTKQRSQAQHQLAVLTGRFPSQSNPLELDLDHLELPRELPVSLPSKLVEQRPDVRAAEAQLHQASAAVGVATANLLPQITLTASLGTIATDPGRLLTPGSGLWSLTGRLLQPVFHGGQLIHQKRAAVAAYDKAQAQYRSTVLHAFQNVADALRALADDADALQAQLAAEQAARRSLDIARQQYANGAISYPVLLQAELSYQQARSALAQAQGARFADTAALFQALGGGWWQRPTDLAAGAVTARDTH